MTSLPVGNETVPSATASPGVEEPVAMEGTSAAGPTTGLESTDVAGPSSRGEGTSHVRLSHSGHLKKLHMS